MNVLKYSGEEECLSNGVINGQDDDPIGQEKQEREHFQRVINAFKYYRVHFVGKMRRTMMNTHHERLMCVHVSDDGPAA